MKSKNNKRMLASVLNTFCVGVKVTLETKDNRAFCHDEADITMISYILEAAYCGKGVICVVSDDTGVCVLLVYWVFRLQLASKVQMECWDGTLLNINSTCVVTSASAGSFKDIRDHRGVRLIMTNCTIILGLQRHVVTDT